MTDIDLSAAIAFHQQNQAMATLVLTRVKNPLEYGVVITKEDGKIERFLEKPGWSEVFSDTVNTGIYILEPEALKYFKKGEVFDFSKDLFPKMVENGEKILGYIAEGYWSDIGNIEQYRQAHYDILNQETSIEIAGKEIEPGIWVGENADLDQRAKLTKPVLIGDFSRIKPGVEISEYTVIGNYSTIEENTSLKKATVGNNCYIGPGSELRGCILADHNYCHGKNNIFEGAVLGEKVSLGTKVTIKTGIKVWPEKKIDSGSLLSESLIWAKKSACSLFGNNGISGIVGYEITPEFTAKIGTAFGAQLQRGSTITISCDNFKQAKVLKRAMVAGVLASGTNVYDLGTIPLPLARYALVNLQAHGGVYLRVDSQNSQNMVIEFFNEQGIHIAKNKERSLENSFCTEDFPRAAADSFGELMFVPQMLQPYLQGFISSEAKKLIQKANFRIVAYYENSSLSFLLPAFFEELHCEVVPVSKIEGNQQQILEEIKSTLQSHQATLGILPTHNGEKLMLLDENGEMITEDELVAVLSYIVLKTSPKTTLPVPINASQIIEELASEFQGKIVRTKAHPRSVMERTVQEKLFSDMDEKYQHHPQFDAAFCLVKILELMAKEKISLSDTKKLITELHITRQEIDCPWEEKGRIMRQLFEENQSNDLDTTDGLKIFHETGWALVLPDAEEPVFKIYSEAGSLEEADALAKLYLERINSMQQISPEA